MTHACQFCGAEAATGVRCIPDHPDYPPTHVTLCRRCYSAIVAGEAPVVGEEAADD